jgi:thiol-disulfide isomerase/thioredoxin
MANKKCPVCGVSVKLENLEKHVRIQHPRAKVDLSAALTQTERREAKRAQALPCPKMTRGGKRLVAVIAIVLAAVLLLIIFNPFRGVGPNVGDVAPDFAIPTCPDGSVQLSSYRGAPVLLELMDVDCVFCKAEAPVLKTVYDTYGSRVHFLSVSLYDYDGPLDTCSRIADFQANYSAYWLYGRDVNHDVREKYPFAPHEGTPTTYILDSKGVISARFVGRVPGGAPEYAAALQKVL